MKRQKNLHGFSYAKNMPNFEAFRWNFSSSTRLLFLKSDITNAELDSLSNNFVFFLYFSEMSLETLPHSILWRRGKPEKLLIFSLLPMNDRKKPPSHHDWRILWYYLKKIKYYSTPIYIKNYFSQSSFVEDLLKIVDDICYIFY